MSSHRHHGTNAVRPLACSTTSAPRSVLRRAAASVPLDQGSNRRAALLEPLEGRRLLAGDFSTLGDAFADKLAGVQFALHGALNSASKVPFLNENLGKAKEAELYTDAQLNQLRSQLNGQTSEGTIEDIVFGILGPPGARVLADTTGDGVVSIADVNATVDEAAGTARIDFKLGRNLGEKPFEGFEFGLGLPGVPLNVTANTKMLLSLDIGNDGVSFSFDDDNLDSINPGTITVSAQAKLAAGSEVKGTFGFLDVTAKDLAGTSKFGGTFTIDNLMTSADVSLTGEGLVDLHLTLGAGAQFPSLQADLKVDWDFAGAPAGAAPSIRLDNIGIGLGTFIGQVMTPVLKNIKYFTEPHQPVVDVLKARIPGLSDGTNAIGLGDVSIQSLVRMFQGELPQSWQQYVNVAMLVIDVTDIINKIDLQGKNPVIVLGNLDLSGENGTVDFRAVTSGMNDYSKLGQHGLDLNSLKTGTLKLSLADIQAKLQGLVDDSALSATAKDQFNSALAKLTDGASYSFPILDDPAGCAFKLLLGQDADLAEFEVKVTDVTAAFKETFPYKIFGYGINFTGEIKINGFFRTAYDTFGLREFIGELAQSPGSANPADLLKGLYIDADTKLTVGGEINADVDTPIPGLIVRGGIKTPQNDPLSLQVNDGPNNDGKLRPFADDTTCVLKADGRLDAEFEARVKIGVTIFNPFGDDVFIGINESLVSVGKNMIKLDNDDGTAKCLGGGSQTVPPPPVLAGIVGDGQLQLYVGPNAHKRQNVGSNTDVAESYIVTHLDGAAGDEKISVTAFGVTQTFEHVKSVWADGGNENDVLMLEAGVLAPATLFGGNGNDALSHNGPGRAEIRAWFGNDTLNGGDGNDSLYGEDGEDLISTGGGNNHAEGNAGHDTINAGGGNDSLFGGTGNDLVHAGGGNDSIQGNEGDDRVEAGDGADFILGGDGKDTLRGGAGNDTILGENDPDSLIGDAGDDFIGGHGGGEFIAGDEVTFDASNTGSLGAGGGHDTIFGDGDGDVIYAQGGSDYVEGNAGFDGIFGGEGNDRLIGGSSNAANPADVQDSIDGGAGDDIILGDDGAITPTGVVTLGGPTTGAGNDTVRGGAGNDLVWGQGGNDSIFGDAGDDDLIGNNGGDTMDGGAGADVLLGDNGTITPTGTTLPESTSSRRSVALATDATTDGSDSMLGGADADTLFGQGGNDSLGGDAGVDYLEGNQGNDVLSGGDDDDDLIGGSSAAGTPDGSDTLSGDGGHDVLAGDNAAITRIVNVSSFVRHATTGMQNNAIVRMVDLHDVDTAGTGDSISGGAGDDSAYGQAGNDSMFGNDGHDDLTGHFGDDLMDGGAGDDGIVGDKGTITGSVLAGPSRTIAIPSEKLQAVVNVAGTRLRSVTLEQFALGGNDTLIGGANNDYVHGGAGNDAIEGDDPATPAVGGRDALFGDWGNDSMNGGAGGDHVYGGGGDDSMNGQAGPDTLYGGDGLDSLWSDESGDRLIDWFGNYNNFYVPGPGFGQPIIIRSPSPAVQQFLQNLGASDGSWNSELELEIVTPPSPENAGSGA